MPRRVRRPARIAKAAIATAIPSHHLHSRSNSSRHIPLRICLHQRAVDFPLACIRKISSLPMDTDRRQAPMPALVQVHSHPRLCISRWAAQCQVKACRAYSMDFRLVQVVHIYPLPPRCRLPFRWERLRCQLWHPRMSCIHICTRTSTSIFNHCNLCTDHIRICRHQCIPMRLCRCHCRRRVRHRLTAMAIL